MASNLQEALDAYWNAPSRQSEQSAYNEVKLFGGLDGYPNHGPIRSWVIQVLRRMALWLEERKWRV